MCLTLFEALLLMTFLRQIFLLVQCTMLNQTLAFFLIGWVTNGPSHDGFQDQKSLSIFTWKRFSLDNDCAHPFSHQLT